jgi:hypothetical protein
MARERSEKMEQAFAKSDDDGGFLARDARAAPKEGCRRGIDE